MSEHGTAPSSGSVTVTEYGILSPNANVPPSTGRSMLMAGLVLPTVMIVLTAASRPPESVTRSTAV